MRNKFLWLIFGLMVLTGSSKAETLAELGLEDQSGATPVVVYEPVGGSVLSKIPGMHQGVGFSVIDSKFNYLTTIDIVTFKGISLEGGYMGRAKNSGDKLVAVVSYDLFNAKKAGVTIPILDLIDVRVGAYGGFGRIQIGSENTRDGGNELDAGISFTGLNIKW